jgi:hypothetical protein
MSARCSSPNTSTSNLVSRKEAEPACNYARAEFSTGTSCGPEGKYWELKPKVVKKPSFFECLRRVGRA